MKRILLAGLFLWSSISSAALPLKTRGQNDASTTGTDTLRLEAPNSQVTKIGDQKVLIETGNENLLINPNFEDANTLNGWTIPSGSGWYTDDTSAPREGKKSVDYYHGSSGTGGGLYQQVDPNASVRIQNFEYSMDVRGNSSAATTLKVCILDGVSQTETQCQAVPRDNIYRRYTFNKVPPSSGLTGIGVVADSANSYKVDKAYVGPARNISSGVPNNVFSAKLSASGVLTDLNQPSWISSCYGSRPFTCTLSGFNLAPNCTVTISPSNAAVAPEITAISATSITIDTFITNTGAGSGAPTAIICTRAGTDFIQPAITPNQWNYGRTAYTPTFTGFGTVTNVECYHSRENEYLNIDCKFTVGTSTATEARVSLPGSLVSPTFTQGIRVAGQPVAQAGNVSPTVFPLIESAIGYITFGYQSSTSAGLTKQNANTITNSGTAFSFTARIPIQGWIQNQNAPQLLGSSTTNFNGAHREVFGSFYGANNTSTCSSGTCTMFNSTGDVVATRTAAGNYNLTITPPFNSVPSCTCSRSSLSGSAIECGQNLAGSTASVAKIATQTGSTYTDAQVNFRCWAPR